MNDRIPISFSTVDTEHLILRPVDLGDYESIFEIFSNESLMKPYGMFILEDIEKAKLFTQNLVNDQEVAIVLKEELKIIGTLGFVGYSHYNKRAEIAFVMMDKYWRKGYMHEAVNCLVKFGFEKLDLNRIEAYIFPENIASQMLVNKVGFQKEGLIKKRSLHRGEFRDLILFGLVKN